MILRYLLFTVALIYSANLFGQITSTANFKENTEYSDSDFVFVFCTELTTAGELTANDSTSDGGYVFEWYKFDENTHDFTIVLTGHTVNTDSTSSVISDLEDGGYKVILTKNAEKQEYVAWVYNNNDRNVQLNIHPDSDCNYLALLTEPYYHTTQFFETPLNYYHVDSAEWYTLKNRIVKYSWTASPELESLRSYNGPFTSIGEDPLDNDAELPTENTVFSVVTIDRFGCEAEDDVDYTAIETDADFSWTTLDYKNDEYLESGGSDADLSGPAPLKVKFTNESLNGQDYIWFFGDTLINSDIDTVKTSDILEEPEHIYYYTIADSGKTYTMRMYSTSSHGCRDSIFFDIEIEPSVVKFPNVFTPNHDDYNNVFILTDYQSIKTFKIVIFNRVGQVVHEYEGDVRDWKGWKGDVKNGNQEAPEGNYFFVVDITGWDNVHYDNDKLSNQNKSSGSSGSSEGDNTSGSNTVNFGVVRLYR